MRNADLSIHITKPSNVIDGGLNPLTPLEQTLKTPNLAPQRSISGYNNNDYMEEFINLNDIQNSTMYIQRSDSIISSISDLPSSNFNPNYNLQFTKKFDEIFYNFYQQFVNNPTLTPFNGIFPPSGLINKLNKIFLNILINKNYKNLDTNNFITFEVLISNFLQPILLKLFKKRLIELIKFHVNNEELPATTSITVSNFENSSNLRNCSISNLSLSRSNSNSNSLRKQSLTRNSSLSNPSSSTTNLQASKNNVTTANNNNTHSNSNYNNSNNNNNWLHIGNLNNLRNFSTDSLQSNHDFVPQYMINKISHQYQHQPSILHSNSISAYLETPPQSNKNSVDSINSVALSSFEMEIDEFNFNQSISPSSSILTPPQTVKKSHNLNLSSINNDFYHNTSLHSPFMSNFNEDFNFKSVTAPSTPSNIIGSNLSRESVFMDESIDPLSKTSTTNQKKRESLKLKRGIH